MRLGPFYSSRKLPWIRDRRQRHAIGNACCRCSLGTRDCMVIRSSLGDHRCSRSLDLRQKSPCPFETSRPPQRSRGVAVWCKSRFTLQYHTLVSSNLLPACRNNDLGIFLDCITPLVISIWTSDVNGSQPQGRPQHLMSEIAIRPIGSRGRSLLINLSFSLLTESRHCCPK
jgi:hypothetical protein